MSREAGLAIALGGLPPTVRLVDLGTIDAATLHATPATPVTLYTPSGNERVLRLLWEDYSIPNDGGVVVRSGEVDILRALAHDNSAPSDNSWMEGSSRLFSEALVAYATDNVSVPISHAAWSAALAVEDQDRMLEAGRYWRANSTATTGAGGGKITAISITNGGTGYSDGVVLIFQGDAVASVTLTTAAGVITGVALAFGGGGFTVGATTLVNDGNDDAILSINTVTGPGEPDWAGASVAGTDMFDGVVLWTDLYSSATTGSVHLYALVASPSS